MASDHLTQAVAFLRAHKITHLATAADNVPTVRVMSVAHVEDTGVIWYASLVSSEKVAQIRRQPRVAISAFADGTTVEIRGRADVITDAEVKRARWHESWQPFFPNGHDDPDYVLITITPDEVTVY
ncbi:MAG TPA: pyridoxamine 5'-phosphate oxidase family protein [Armatimonadota bacterium]|nr:pyridoxamine 5'-phosphate oxidase family protein [Armatimonadota bacterium]